MSWNESIYSYKNVKKYHNYLTTLQKKKKKKKKNKIKKWVIK